MVIVIGFVSVGALSFKRSIPLILGTNIGSTFTTEFLAVKLEFLILPSLPQVRFFSWPENPLFGKWA